MYIRTIKNTLIPYMLQLYSYRITPNTCMYIMHFMLDTITNTQTSYPKENFKMTQYIIYMTFSVENTNHYFHVLYMYISILRHFIKLVVS